MGALDPSDPRRCKHYEALWEAHEALLHETLGPALTASERGAALSLAEDVYAIARTHGAIWVPNPRPEIVAIYQRALER